MGGHISTVIHYQGKLHKYCGWTNGNSYSIKQRGLLIQDPVYIEDFMNKLERCQYNYPDAPFAPNGYGLDFIDLDNKEIHTMQGYTDYDTVYSSTIGLCILDKNEEELQIYRELLMDSFDEVKMDGTLLKTHHDFDEFLKDIKKQRSSTWIKIPWQKFGWNMHNYEESYNGCKEFYDYVKSKFKLNQKEKKDWKEFLKEFDY